MRDVMNKPKICYVWSLGIRSWEIKCLFLRTGPASNTVQFWLREALIPKIILIHSAVSSHCTRDSNKFRHLDVFWSLWSFEDHYNFDIGAYHILTELDDLIE